MFLYIVLFLQFWWSSASIKDHGSEKKAESVAKHEAAGNAAHRRPRRWVSKGPILQNVCALISFCFITCQFFGEILCKYKAPYR